jgi:signal transduction histidine kinase
VLVHGTKVGDLRIALRAGECELSDADRRLLDDLTRQVGIAVQAAQLTSDLQTLTGDLQQSRERLVSAREEERRRLRRDLHDGLGPSLASGSFKVEAARNLLRRDPEKADALLAGVADQMQETIEDIRRLVYDLRPPALDQLGLVEGLRQYAGQLDGRTRIVVDASDDLAMLPAAVEVAAYRIGLEALANVLHHAEADHCQVRLGFQGAVLVMEVSDDGRGLPVDGRIGVGLRSMHERATELGGTCDIARRPEGGTRVRAYLPVASPLPVR